MVKRNKFNFEHVNGKWVEESVNWLLDNDGCCFQWFAQDAEYCYAVVIGWHKTDVDDGPGDEIRVGNSVFHAIKCHEEWRICWKIARQTYNNIMQCDFDVDWEMPYVSEEAAAADPSLCVGDVDNTVEEVETVDKKWAEWIENANKPWAERIELGELKLGHPIGYTSWSDLARRMKKVGKRVFNEWSV